MKTKIFYFSGTGNCLQVARDLAEGLEEAEIINIARVIDGEIDFSSGCIGIISPVYMFGAPLIINKFVDKLKVPSDKYIFAVATYGGLPGNSLGQIAAGLNKKGLKLSAGFAVAMPGNYTPLYGAVEDEKQRKMFSLEAQKIKEIVRIVKDRKSYIEKTGFFLINPLLSAFYKWGAPRIPASDKSFWADEKCDNCGICRKVCPVNNIDIVEGKPVWQHKCEQCLACLQWCPREAIQYNKATIGRKRYRNPRARLEDFIMR